MRITRNNPSRAWRLWYAVDLSNNNVVASDTTESKCYNKLIAQICERLTPKLSFSTSGTYKNHTVIKVIDANGITERYAVIPMLKYKG